MHSPCRGRVLNKEYTFFVSSLKANKNYLGFISYSNSNLSFALRLKKALDSSGYIPNEKKRFFLDTVSMAEDDLNKTLEEALDNSEFLIVICSPESLHSPGVNSEIDYFIKHHEHPKILPVILSGNLANTDCLPKRLRSFSDSTQTLAFRNYSLKQKGFQGVVDYLICTMLGIDAEESIHQWKTERRKQFAHKVLKRFVLPVCSVAVVAFVAWLVTKLFTHKDETITKQFIDYYWGDDAKPHGIGASLGPEVLKTLPYSYRFTYSGKLDRLIKVERINRFESLSDEDFTDEYRPAVMLFSKGEQHDTVTFKNARNRPYRQLVIDNQNDGKAFFATVNDIGIPQEIIKIIGNPSSSLDENISCQQNWRARSVLERFSYEDGRVFKRSFHTNKLLHHKFFFPNANGVCYIESIQGTNRRDSVVRYRDHFENPMFDNKHRAGYLLEYNNDGRIVRKVFLDLRMKPAPDFEERASILYEYDDAGQLCRISNHSLSGELTMGPDGYSYLERQFDDKGYEDHFFDTLGHVCFINIASNEYSSARHEFENGHPVCSIWERRDSDGNLVFNEERSHAKLKRYYKDGNVIRAEYLDTNEELCNGDHGYAYWLAEYDQMNRRTSLRYFDKDGHNSTSVKKGYAGYDITYSGNTDSLRVQYRETDNSPGYSKELGCSAWVLSMDYNTDGSTTYRFSCYDKKGEHCLNKELWYDFAASVHQRNRGQGSDIALLYSMADISIDGIDNHTSNRTSNKWKVFYNDMGQVECLCFSDDRKPYNYMSYIVKYNLDQKAYKKEFYDRDVSTIPYEKLGPDDYCRDAKVFADDRIPIGERDLSTVECSYWTAKYDKDVFKGRDFFSFDSKLVARLVPNGVNPASPLGYTLEDDHHVVLHEFRNDFCINH